ncbi:DUF6765 family protein [Pseudomonadota bacterium]
MQIDFHHAVTYVVARYAGFAHREAAIVAHCAQYVDDATNAGTISFTNGAMFTRIASAHKMLDYRNFDELANHHCWIPFHFLPGNGGKPMGENPKGSFIDKIICRPNSYVAQDMVRSTILDQDQLYGLHRLGVAMHVYADTWAHQGFAGVNHRINDIRALDDHDQPDEGFLDRLKDRFEGRFDRIASKFVGDALPLGHGAALSHPDKPYLKWSYRDADGNKVERDNPKNFLEAAEQMCITMQRYRVRDPDANVPGLSQIGRDKIDHLLRTITDSDGDERHQQWLQHIGEGHFGFPAVRLEYQSKDTGSWKHEATGTQKHMDEEDDHFEYHPSFLGSDWKLFHDAIWAHRFDLIHDILPRYGICAA